jgi:autotransporter-associated beta strand protein
MKPKCHTLNPSFLRYGALPLLLATSSLIVPAMAQTGTWTGDTTPLTWTTTGNWSGGTVATGSGNTANFTNNITGDRVINITADQTIGNIVFSDSDTATAGSWTIANNGTSTNNLIFAGTTPTVTVNALGAAKLATISAVIEGTAGLTKSGEGILLLSSANTFSGGLNIGAGTLRFSNLGSLGNGNVTIGGSGNTVIDFSGGNSTISANVTGWTLTGAGTITRSNSAGSGIGWGIAKITGSSGGLIYTAGNANAVLQVGAVTSDYTGGTTLESGMIVMNGTSNADTTTTGSFGNASVAGNVLTFGGASIRGGVSTTNRTISNNLSFAADTTHAATTNGVAGTLTWAGEMTLNGTGSVRQFTQASLTQDWVFSNAIKNGTVSNFTVNITGSRSVTFSGANTFDGTLLATGTGGGALALGHVNAVQNATLDTGSATASRAVTFTAAGTNTYNIGALQGADDLDIGANTLSVGAKAVDTSFTGAISGSGGLTKVGANKLTLSGTNTYAGATTIEAGTLYVTGALSNSAVTVGANGTIGSNGSAGGLANGLTINAGGNLDLTGATINTNSTGVLSLTGGSLTLGALTFQDLVGWDWLNAAEGTYELIDGSFSINWGSTVYLSEATAYDFGNGKKGYFTSGSLQAVIIPEPSAALLGGLGLLALLRRRR